MPPGRFQIRMSLLFLGALIMMPPSGFAAAAPMTLPQIESALAAAPPDWGNGDERAAIAAAMDAQVHIQVTKTMTDADRAELRPLLAFYRRRVDAGLDALERTRVTSGVLAVKFYSSALVLKSAQGTVAVDFCQGPVNNAGEPEQRDEERTGFYLTPGQRDRLAHLVDACIITHRHHDHADYSLARRLTAQGKPVIGPAQLKTAWKDLAAGVTVPDYGKAQRIGPLELYTMLGCQCGRNEAGADGQRIGVPHVSGPDGDSQSVVYLFRMGGKVFMQGAENHIPCTEWLQRGIELGFAPEIVLSVGQFQGQRSADAVLSRRPPVFHIPVHEYEFKHDGGGNRTTPWFTGSGRRAFEQHRTMPLFWGESYLLK